MATGIVLHPLARERLQELQTALQSEFGVDATHRDIVAAAVHGATPAQLAGMLIEFTKAKAASA
jgi:hypothetical protein